MQTPRLPAAKNTILHPAVSRIIPISGGARTDPTAVPALIIPIAVDRWCNGIHSATTLVAAGKAPPSPIPKQATSSQQKSEVHRKTMQRAGSRPPQHDQNEPSASSYNIQHPSPCCIQRRIGNQERKLQPRKLLVAKRYRSLNRRDGDGQASADQSS